MKICSRCKEPKNFDDFGNRSSTKDGLMSWCKECTSRINKRYDRGKKGVVRKIYGQQTTNSKVRNHPEPTYTRQWLEDWLQGQELFHRLYDEWVASNYDKYSRPSVDRIEDELPYTTSNIQLMTWRENLEKGTRSKSKEVAQYDIDWNLVDLFQSTKEAGRQTGINHLLIARVCRLERNMTYGFRWVSVRGDGKKYIAHINPSEGKAIHLGSFDTIEEAIEARRIAETKYY